MNLKKVAVQAALSVAAILLVAGIASATTRTVPAPYPSIQSAVNASQPGDTVSIAAGTYDERVVVSISNLTITGSGQGLTIIKPSGPNPSGNTTSLFSGLPIDAIVLVKGATGVTIQALTVDGQTGVPAGCEPTYVGVFYRAASGAILDSGVTNIFNPAAAGCQGYLAIFVQSGNGGPSLNSDVTIARNTVDKYGKNGITANEPGTSITVTSNIVTGRGAVGLGDAAQNGVQLGFGAHGKVTDNNISGHNYTPASYIACGILATNGGGAIGQTKSNTFAANEQNVCNAGGGPSMNSPFNR